MSRVIFNDVCVFFKIVWCLTSSCGAIKVSTWIFNYNTYSGKKLNLVGSISFAWEVDGVWLNSKNSAYFSE